MNWKGFLFLLALTIGMFVVLQFWVIKPIEKTEEAKEKSSKLISQDLKTLDRLELREPNKEPVILVKTDGVWYVEGSFKDIASDGQMTSLFGAMERAKTEEKLLEGAEYEARKNDLDQYGLTEKAFRLVLFLAGSKDPLSLLIGDAAPGGLRFYAQWSGVPVVHLIGNDLDFVRRQRSDDFREKRLITLDDDKILRVEIQSRGKPTIEIRRDKADQPWKMTKPFELPVDQEFVRARISKLVLVRANTFVDSKPSSLKSPEFRVKLLFPEEVHDKRSRVGDPLPNGIELLVSRQPRSGIKKPGPDDYDYYGVTDKTPAATIARFHYDNLNHDAKEFVQRSFDDFTADQVTSLSVLENGKPTQEWRRLESGKFEIQNLKDGSKVAGQDIPTQTALHALRNLKPETLLDLNPPKKTQTLSFQVKLSLKDGSAREFSFQDTNSDADFWWSYKDQKLRYWLKGKSLDLSLWRIEKLSSVAPAETKSKDTAQDPLNPAVPAN